MPCFRSAWAIRSIHSGNGSGAIDRQWQWGPRELNKSVLPKGNAMPEPVIAATDAFALGSKVRRVLALSYFTVAYNIVEGLASVIFGRLAGSTALVGFGLDSFIESLSGAVMIWRFHGHAGRSEHEHAHREQKAVRLVGIALLLLG